jgi:hypothetical protein
VMVSAGSVRESLSSSWSTLSSYAGADDDPLQASTDAQVKSVAWRYPVGIILMDLEWRGLLHVGSGGCAYRFTPYTLV